MAAPKDTSRRHPPRWQVVHFILDARVGGPHHYVQTLLRAQGASVHGWLVTAGRGPMTDIALVNLRGLHRLLYPLEVLVNAALIVARFGWRGRPSLLHVHGAANTAPLLAAVVARLPVVWHLHETVASQRALASIGSWLLGATRHAIVSVSAEGREAFGFRDALLAPGAVDTGFWHRPADRPPQTTSAGVTMRLLAVANWNPLKGLDLLLEALAAARSPVTLTIVGAELATQRAHAAQLRALAGALSARTPPIRVEFAGSLPSAQVRDLLLQADAFVLPSRSEACPIALLESMAMGLPCVATDVGDVRAILPDLQHALICPANDVAALAAAIDRLACLPAAARHAAGVANRWRIESDYSPVALAKLISTCYEKLLEHPTSSTSSAS